MTTKEVKYPGNVQYELTSLIPDTFYKIELRAHNEMGFSQPAEIIVKTAPGNFHFNLSCCTKLIN